jgi:hypothetical protein
MARNGSFWRNPFSFLFARSATEDRVAAYVIREHAHGRPLNEVLDDPFVRNRMTPEQSSRLLDRPDVLEALGRDTIEALRRS